MTTRPVPYPASRRHRAGRFAEAIGLAFLVGIAGACVGAFLIEWVRTPNTGLFLYEKGEAFLKHHPIFLFGGESLLKAWKDSALNQLTAYAPGIVAGFWTAVAVWFGMSMGAAWQNCNLFSGALRGIALRFVPLYGYLALLFLNRNPRVEVGHWIAVLPFGVTAFLVAGLVRRTRESSVPARPSEAPVERTWDFVPLGFVLLVSFLLFLDWNKVACLRHNNFYSQGYDMALMSHVMKNIVTGHGDVSSLLFSGGHFLGHHFSPILYLLAPVYFFSPHPETLILIQCAAVAFASVPLFLFARNYLGSPWAAAAISVTYLYLPGLSNALNADFHAISLAPLFLFWLVHAVFKPGPSRYWIPWALLIAVQENTFLYALSVGLFAFLHRFGKETPKEVAGRGWRLIAASCVAAVLIFGVFQPIFRPDTDRGYGFTGRYSDFVGSPRQEVGPDYLGASLDPNRVEGETIGILKLAVSILTQPGKIVELVSEENRRGIYSVYWGGVLFLPLLNPLGWLFLGPCMENTLSSEGHLFLWTGHYGFGPTALSALALIAGYRLLMTWGAIRKRLAPLACAFAFSQVIWSLQRAGLPFSVFMMEMFFGFPVEGDSTREVLTTSIPAGSVVSAQSHLLPHLTHQKNLYLIPPALPAVVDPEHTKDVNHPTFEELEPSEEWPEYIALNPGAADGLNWYNAWFFTPERTRDWATWLEETGRYERVFPKPGTPDEDAGHPSLIILRARN